MNSQLSAYADIKVLAAMDVAKEGAVPATCAMKAALAIFVSVVQSCSQADLEHTIWPHLGMNLMINIRDYSQEKEPTKPVKALNLLMPGS